jgi:hypothetical protein
MRISQKKLAKGLDLLEKSNTSSKLPVHVISAEELMGRRGVTDQEIILAAGPEAIVFTKDKDWENIKECLNQDVPPYIFEFDIRKGIKQCHL